MCRSHWFSLTSRLRTAVSMAYRKGQCDDWKPSAKYCEVAKKAVIYVARREGLTPDTKLYDLFLERARNFGPWCATKIV